MLDTLTVRLVAGFLLTTLVIGFVLFRRRAACIGIARYEPVAGIDVSKALHVVWVIVAVFAPPTALVLTVAAPGLDYGTWMNVSFPGDAVVQFLGIGLFFAGGGLSLASARNLGRFMVIDIAVAKDHQLVTTGPYAWIRHPTYTAVMLVALSVAMLLLSLIMVLNFVIAATIAVYRARLEERLLSSEEGFGSRYRDYVSRTGRFLPRPGGWRRRESE